MASPTPSGLGKQTKAERALGAFEIEQDGVRVRSTGWWRSDSRESVSMRAFLKLRGFVSSHVSSEGNSIGWVLSVTRTRVNLSRPRSLACRKGYVARLSYNDQPAGVTMTTDVMRGTCSGWSDAIEEVRQLGGRAILQGMRASGSLFYGHDGAGWHAVRPFVVKYPWYEPNEPNFFYTPFNLPPGVALGSEDDGAHHYVFGWDRDRVVETSLALRCNAFLRGPDSDGKYAAYHRDYMSAGDPIDVDDWRARLIASAKDD